MQQLSQSLQRPLASYAAESQSLQRPLASYSATYSLTILCFMYYDILVYLKIIITLAIL